MTAATRPLAIDPRIKARRDDVEQAALRKRAQRWLLALIILLVFCAGAAASQSTLLDVDRIVIHGATTTSPQQVAELSGVTLHEPLTSLDLGAAATAIATLPTVDEVTVRRNWNGTVSVNIVERRAVAQFLLPDTSSVVVDGEGRVLSVDAAVREGLPIVEGLTVATSAGQWLDSDGVNLASIAAALPADVARASRTLRADPDGLRLLLGAAPGDLSSEGGQVLLGDGRQLSEKFWAVRAFLHGVDLECLATLDVRAPSVPVVVRHESCQSA